MALTAGSRLGSHEIVSLIGAGGMGEVYLALDTKLNRRVAIKVLPDAFASDPERVARFQREAQAVAALNHPRIAAIYELAESTPRDGAKTAVRYFVLELVDGDTLADRIARGPIPPEEAIRTALQILEALEVAHEKGICHRDLKPANVKLTADGAVKVLDFGLAKFVQSGPSAPQLTHSPTLTLAATTPGVVLGTAGYMSPEQAKGFEADQRSDIFSFGCVLYELLSGRRAFEGDTVSDILASVLKTDVDMKALPPRLNPRLIELLRRCLEKDPRKRWHAAADVRIELESLAGQAIVRDDPRASSIERRPLWQRVAALSVATLMGAAVAGYLAWALKPTPTQVLARFAVPLAEGSTFTNTGRQLVALSPDGANLVYVADQRLYLRSLESLEARPIPGSEITVDGVSGVTNPVFSPDGKEIVFFSGAERKLKRLATTGGVAVTVCDAENPLGMSWSEHGIVFGQSEGIMRVAPRGGTVEVIVPQGSGGTLASPQILPDGKTLLYSVRQGTDSWDKAHVVVQPIGGARTELFAGADARYVPTGHLVYALSGVLYAVAFDVNTLTVSGGPSPIVEGVKRAINTPSSPVAQFSFSAGGTLAYIPGPVTIDDGGGGLDLALFDRKSGREHLGLPRAQYAAPRVTRDGKRVAFERTDDPVTNIYTLELGAGRVPQRLTFSGNSRAPVWSPDGEFLAYQSDRDGSLAIYRQRADGSGTAERLTEPDANVAHVPQSWSRDGKHLLFTVITKESERSLKVLTLDDRGVADYAGVPALDAVFSPDGRWVAYTIPNPGSIPSTVVFIEPFPSTGAKYQMPQPGGQPFWSPKGDELIMNTAPNSSTSFPLTLVPFSVYEPRPFPRQARIEGNPATTRRNVDMMPDNEHVIGLTSLALSTSTDDAQGETTAKDEIVVFMNWFEELRQRVPRR